MSVCGLWPMTNVSHACVRVCVCVLCLSINHKNETICGWALSIFCFHFLTVFISFCLSAVFSIYLSLSLCVFMNDTNNQYDTFLEI